MIKFLIALISLVFNLVSLPVQAAESPQKGLDTAHYLVGGDKAGIRIEVQNQSLDVVLQKISRETGIGFTFPESIKTYVVNVSIVAPDWPSALSELLGDYNRMEVWSDDLNQTRIRIMGDGDMESTSSLHAASPQIPLKRGDPVQMETGYFKTHPVKQGDWVAIKTGMKNRPGVTRVLAAAGDTVEIRDGQLWVNGRIPLDLQNGRAQKIPAGQMAGLQSQINRFGSRVPEGVFIAIGDNAGNPIENTDFRMISEKRLLGRVK